MRVTMGSVRVGDVSLGYWWAPVLLSPGGLCRGHDPLEHLVDELRGGRLEPQNLQPGEEHPAQAAGGLA